MDAIELTRKLVSIRSINPGGDEHDCAYYLGELLSEYGFDVSYYDFAPRRTSVVARRRGSPLHRDLCFAGHIDTVPLGNQQWSLDPFAAEINDGKLYGRGTSDMKAGIASFVTAATSTDVLGDDGPGLILIMAAGEETGCEGSRPLGELLAPSVDVGAMIVAEPSYNLPKVGHRGALWLRMRTAGKTAHGSMPELGVNALYKAARAVTHLEDFDFNIARHPHLGGNSLSVGNLHSGLNVNSVPDAATMEVDVRTIPGVDHETVRRNFHQYLGPDIEEIYPFVNLDSVWTDPENPWVKRVFDVITPFLGEHPAVEALPFFTDAAVLKPAFGDVPTVILGPGETHMAHQTDEFCVVERIPQAVGIYKALIEDWVDSGLSRIEQT